jgi:hypothetical protein
MKWMSIARIEISLEEAGSTAPGMKEALRGGLQ